MTLTVPAALRAAVIARAEGRCEYCHLSQDGQEAMLHIDHVIPRFAGGGTVLDNLALACVGCSLRKGARERGIDPVTGEPAALFSPPPDVWPQHLRWHASVVEGVTATGRATVVALMMNRPLMVAIREEEALRGRLPGR